MWRVMRISGIAQERISTTTTGTARGRSAWIVSNRKPLAIVDIATGQIPAGETTRSLGFRGYLGVPLFARGGEVIGVLRAMTYKPRQFTQEEADLLQQLANALPS